MNEPAAPYVIVNNSMIMNDYNQTLFEKELNSGKIKRVFMKENQQSNAG